MENLLDQSVAPSSEDVSEPESIDEEEENVEDVEREAIRQRLYAHKKPAEKLKRSPPQVAEHDYALLKEHVRMMNGQSPRLIKKTKFICWMDSPDIKPKSNWTTEERHKHIRDRMEERKDSEEDPFSARCVN